MKAEAIAYRRFRVAAEAVRLAATDLERVLRDIDGLEIDYRCFIDALRAEFTDWPDYIRRMQIVGEVLESLGAPTRIDVMVLSERALATSDEVHMMRFDEGFLAYHLGTRLGECPYERETPAYLSWRQGWLDAKSTKGRS